eukprot:1854547-Pyramimonas_sp.AAC.1
MPAFPSKVPSLDADVAARLGVDRADIHGGWALGKVLLGLVDANALLSDLVVAVELVRVHDQ